MRRLALALALFAAGFVILLGRGPRRREAVDSSPATGAAEEVAPAETLEVPAAAEAAAAEPAAEPRVPVPPVPPGPAVPVADAASTTCTITGIVVDPDGNPVRNADVRRSLAEKPWRDNEAKSAYGDGTFVFEGVAPNEHALVASAQGWAKSERLVLALAPGEVREVRLELGRPGAIRVTAIGEDGEPLAGWVVGASSAVNSSAAMSRARSTRRAAPSSRAWSPRRGGWWSDLPRCGTWTSRGRSAWRRWKASRRRCPPWDAC